jgi:molecular chaperone GrpE (heat shock protein)
MTEENDDELKRDAAISEEAKNTALPAESNASGEPIAGVPAEPVAEPSAAPIPDEPVAVDTFKPSMTYKEVGNIVSEIQKRIGMIVENQDRERDEVRDMHRELASSLRREDKMQEELEKHRKGLFQQLLVPFLSSLGKIYNDYMGALERIEDPKTQKTFRYLLDDLEQLMMDNGVDVYTSNIGDPCSPKYCVVREKTATNDKALHRIIIKSHNKCFFIGPKVLVSENVDVYVYDNTKEQGQTGTDPANSPVQQS